MKKWGFRQYVYQTFRIGLLRPEGSEVLLNNGDIKGLRLRDFKGSSTFNLNLESEFYTPSRFMGFQARIFAFADLGLQGGASNVPLASARLYHAYGAGIRLNHWKLGLAFLEVAFVYYPNTRGAWNRNFEIAPNYYNSKVIERNSLYEWQALQTIDR